MSWLLNTTLCKSYPREDFPRQDGSCLFHSISFAAIVVTLSVAEYLAQTGFEVSGSKTFQKMKKIK
jgi:hypothetical protein